MRLNYRSLIILTIQWPNLNLDPTIGLGRSKLPVGYDAIDQLTTAMLTAPSNTVLKSFAYSDDAAGNERAKR